MNSWIKQHSRWLGAGAVLVAVLALGWWLGAMTAGGDQTGKSGDEGEGEPLYWVAPMDSSYRRDEPGKSPMGMDLVPVYEEDKGAEEGTVTISSAVENNLGVRTAPVERGELALDVHTVGYVQFNEDDLVHFHSRVDGWVEQLSVTAVGDPVEEGQKLFELYSPELVNAQDEYLAAIGSGSSMLRSASESRLQALGVNDDQIRQLRRTGKVRQRLDFFAQQDGYVAELNIREGMFIKPAMTIMSIGSLETVWVIAEIFERQADWVEKGRPVEMTVPGFPGHEWKGEVDYLYPVLNPQTRTLKARVVFDNPDHRLKPNMFAELTIHGGHRSETLSVPREAVIRDGRMSRVVKVTGDGRYRSVRIEPGIESGGRVEVLKGLKAGDRIVTSAQFLIDSESSIDAELGRIEGETGAGGDKPASVRVEGEIQNLMVGHRMATIEHAPVPEWDWPAMSMDFNFGDDVDLSQLENGMAVRFRLERGEDDQYLITDIEPAGDGAEKTGPAEQTGAGQEGGNSHEGHDASMNGGEAHNHD